MIVWLSSYPKSGNTWIRAMLTSYFSDNSKDVFDIINKIDRFPNHKYFKDIISDEEIEKNDKEIFKYFITAQRRINSNKKLNIIKTHNFAGSINGFPFSNSDNTSGFIYIVRDPRAVAVSFSYHQNISFEKSVSMMLNPNLLAHNGKYTEARLSWKIHVLSWMNSPWPKVLIKYENLHNDPKNHFKKILLFLSKFIKIDIDEEKINKTVEKCSFENLSKLENQKGFSEKKGNVNFFRKGLINEWEEVLPYELKRKIETNFEQEMKILKYL